jgi:hypothetical protein
MMWRAMSARPNLKVLLHCNLGVHVEFPLFHIVDVFDDLVFVTCHALQLADVELVQRRLRAQRVVGVEELRAVAARLDPGAYARSLFSST